MKVRRLLDKSGQTSIEYLLMLVVSVGLGMTFYKKFNEYFLTNPNSYLNGYLSNYRTILNSDSPDGYKRFRLTR